MNAMLLNAYGWTKSNAFKIIQYLTTLTPQAAIFWILESASIASIFKTTKYLSVTFYLYLSYMCLSLEKKSS